jgi:hypothetical protein
VAFEGEGNKDIGLKLAITENLSHHENCEDTVWQAQTNRLFDSSEIIADILKSADIDSPLG